MKPLRSFSITESNSSVSRQSKTLLCYRDTVSTAKMFGSRKQRWWKKNVKMIKNTSETGNMWLFIWGGPLAGGPLNSWGFNKFSQRSGVESACSQSSWPVHKLPPPRDPCGDHSLSARCSVCRHDGGWMEDGVRMVWSWREDGLMTTWGRREDGVKTAWGRREDGVRSEERL